MLCSARSRSSTARSRAHKYGSAGSTNGAAARGLVSRRLVSARVACSA